MFIMNTSRRVSGGIRLPIVFVGLLFGFSPGLLAQASEAAPKSWGSVFYGIGGATDGDHSTGIHHLGVGVESLIGGGLGVGAELGWVAPFDGLADGLGIFSPGVVYAFGPGRRTVPFVVGGYSLFFRSGTAHGVYLGAGLNHWVGRRWGLRLEGRNQIMVQHNIHFIEGRVALILR